MTSDKQNQSNQQNAKHSTGPRTDEGKQRSSQNALKHGLCAKRSVIPGEDPAAYEAHLDRFQDTFNPSNAFEVGLVRQMADADWRLLRINHLEVAFIASAVDDALACFKIVHPDDPEPSETKLLGDIMQTRTADLTRFSRYHADHSRRYREAFRQLIEMRELDNRDRRRNREAVEAANQAGPDDRHGTSQAPRRPPWREEESTKPSRIGITSNRSTTSDPPGHQPSDESTA
jgi:hypothetical protein